MAVQLGTVEFYEAMAAELNNDPVWAEKGKDLSYRMAYVFGPPIDKQFYMAFDGGQVTEVREANKADCDGADFVITGPPEVWRGIFAKEMNPMIAITRGQMKIKGKMMTLLKNMDAFNYVIEAMTRVDFE